MVDYVCGGNKCGGVCSDINEWTDHADICFQDGLNPYDHRLAEGLGPEPEIIQTYLAEWDERNANRTKLMRALTESTGMSEEQVIQGLQNI